MFKLIDEKIQKSFSNAAMQYDASSGLHREIGQALLEKISSKKNCSSVLDVGMGTGWLANQLTSVFPDAEVVGVDFAKGMVEEAKNREGNFKAIQACAMNLPFENEYFDMVVSNLAYQWVSDLPLAFQQAYSVLKNQGVFCCVLFGHDTFKELFEALALACNVEELSIKRLPQEQYVVEAVHDVGFDNVEVKRKYIKTHFSDMMALMKWIKDMGANTLPRDFFVGKDLLRRSNEYYDERFRDHLGVNVTLEVLWVEGVKHG